MSICMMVRFCGIFVLPTQCMLSYDCVVGCRSYAARLMLHSFSTLREKTRVPVEPIHLRSFLRVCYYTTVLGHGQKCVSRQRLTVLLEHPSPNHPPSSPSTETRC